MRDRRASEKGAEEPSQADDQSFAPLHSEDCGIEFRASEKGEDDGPGAGQKRDPLGVAEQPAMGQKRDEHKLGHRAHHNLRECG